MNADVLETIQLALGSVFFVSAIRKLPDLREFADSVVLFHVLPRSISVPLGFVIPPVELAIALSHLIGVLIFVGALTGSGVLLCFVTAIALNLVRGIRVPCSCFGVKDGEVISLRSLVRLSLMLAGEFTILGGLAPTHSSYRGTYLLTSHAAALIPQTLLLLIVAIWTLEADKLLKVWRPGTCKSCAKPDSSLSPSAGK